MKINLLVLFSFFPFLLFLAIPLNAQSISSGPLILDALFFADASTDSSPLLEQNANAVEPYYASTQFFKRSKDSLSARREFTNSITCVGLVLRATKSVYASRINMPSIHELRVFGIGYEHKVYRNVNIGAGYYVWKQFSPWFNDVSVNCEPQAIVAGHERGVVQRLNKYKMFDVFGKYFLNRGHHQIDAGIGFSYTWGDNTVIDSIFSYPGHDVVISHNESANYGGVFVLIGYHYYFLHNRLSIGYEINWRNYFGIYSPFLQNGLSARFRF